MKNSKLLKAASLILTVGLLGRCGTRTPDNSYDTTTAETVGESVGGAASQSDNGGSIVTLNNSKQPLVLTEKLKLLAQDFLMPKAFASSCSTSVMVMGTSCVGSTMTITLGGCTGYLGTWTGTASLQFNSAAACSNASAGGLMATGNGNSVVLTSVGGLTLTAPSGYSVETDSNSSGYLANESGGTQITCGGSGCSTSRSVNIVGIHRRLSGPFGSAMFDHTINTPTPLTISGTGASKQIAAGGVIQLQHNLLHFLATSTISQTITFSSGCCFPTGGQIATSFSNGSKSGSETVAFGPGCGQASVNGNNVALSYCQ